MEWLHKRYGITERGLLFTCIGIIVIAIFWQLMAPTNKELEVPTIYSTPLGEVELQLPSGWVVNDTSFEEDGFYSLEVDGPRNASIARLVQEKYEVDINNQSITDEKLIEILSEPIAADYILGFFDIVSGVQFELAESREAWKEELLEQTTSASNTSYSNFEEIESDTWQGYRYTVSIFQGDQTLETVGFFLHGGAAQVEATFYPTWSNNMQFVDGIIDSVLIAEL